MTSSEEIRERLARFAATRDTTHLWPHVSDVAIGGAIAELARVTSAILGGRLQPVVLNQRLETQAVGIAAYQSGLGPLLGFWCETRLLDAPEPVRQVLADHLDHGRRRAARLRGELERVLGALQRNGVEGILLKGLHTGPVYFPHPGTRPASDIDLLVQSADLEAARSTLRALDFVEAEASAHRAHWTPAGMHPLPRSLEFAHADDPWHVDLHTSLDRTLLPGVTAHFATPRPSDCEVWHGLSQSVRVLPQPILLSYLAFHVSSDLCWCGNRPPGVRLLALTELALVAQRDYQRPGSWAAFARVSAAAGIARHVFPALALAERLRPGTVDPGALTAIRGAAPPLLRRLVRCISPVSARRRRDSLLVNLMWTASLGEVFNLLSYAVWPWNARGRVSVRDLLARQGTRLRRVGWTLLPRWARRYERPQSGEHSSRGRPTWGRQRDEE